MLISKGNFGLDDSNQKSRLESPDDFAGCSSENVQEFIEVVNHRQSKEVHVVCYIGLDIEQGKFIRSALRKSNSTWFSKDPDLQIGEEHLFEKSRDPPQISHSHQ